MQRKILISIMLILSSIQIVAQDLKPKEATIKHQKQLRSCWVVHVDPEPKTLKKAWSEYLRNNYGFKLKGIGWLANKDLLEAEDVRVSVISNTPVNFFTHIVEDLSGSEMKVFASDQQDYLSRRHKEPGFEELADILKSFLKSYLPKYHRNRINDTELRIAELTDEAEDLKEEISDNLESIAELEAEIEEMKAQMESNQSKLEEARIKLEKRKAKLQKRRGALQDL